MVTTAIWTRRGVIVALLAGSAACYARGSDKSAPGEGTRQLKPVPGCEGCEAAWERAPEMLDGRIELAGKQESGERLLLRGTVFKPDGRTPAPNTVIYIHHTNSAGLYADGSEGSEWSKRHGRLRGWLRTGADGQYEVWTIKPGPYPNRPDPAHIHLTVLEHGKDPYWIDDVVFEGDPRIDQEYRAERENRGGPGIVRLLPGPKGHSLAQRDVILLAS